MNDITVRGAYGRTYTSIRMARDDWRAGKDFRDVWSGRYINAADAANAAYGIGHVYIRYQNDMKIGLLK